MYPTKDDVKAENRFSAIPIKLPLCSKMSESYKTISAVTKKIKSTFAYVYASYALTYWTTMFAPRFIPRVFMHTASMKFSLAFSNTPGPIKAFKISNPRTGGRIDGTWCLPYVMVAGRVGMTVSCISYNKNFSIVVTSDEAICQDTRFLVDKIYNNIIAEIERMKHIKI